MFISIYFVSVSLHLSVFHMLQGHIGQIKSQWIWFCFHSVKYNIYLIQNRTNIKLGQNNYKYHSTVAVEEAESSLFTGVLSSIITSLLDLNRDLRTKVCTRYSFLVLTTNFFTQLENFGILEFRI